jgi:hypothetical protein
VLKKEKNLICVFDSQHVEEPLFEYSHFELSNVLGIGIISSFLFILKCEQEHSMIEIYCTSVLNHRNDLQTQATSNCTEESKLMGKKRSYSHYLYKNYQDLTPLFQKLEFEPIKRARCLGSVFLSPNEIEHLINHSDQNISRFFNFMISHSNGILCFGISKISSKSLKHKIENINSVEVRFFFKLPFLIEFKKIRNIS